MLLFQIRYCYSQYGAIASDVVLLRELTLAQFELNVLGVLANGKNQRRDRKKPATER